MLISLMHFFGYFNRMLGPGVDPCRRRNGINIALIWRGRGTCLRPLRRLPLPAPARHRGSLAVVGLPAAMWSDSDIAPTPSLWSFDPQASSLGGLLGQKSFLWEVNLQKEEF